jgi:hypothetical protein
MKKCFVALLLTIAATLYGQDTIHRKKIFMEGSIHYGFIVPHNPNIQYLIHKHIVAGEVNVLIQTKGEKRWERVYHHPEKGLGFYFAYLGNPAELGNAIGIYPFINFPLNPSHQLKICLKVANGLGIITNPYDRITNHKNNVSGSGLNAFIAFKLNAVFYPFKAIRMEAGVGLTHLSNGAFATPNKGINIAALTIGMSVLGKSVKKNGEPITSDSTAKKKYFFSVLGATALNENNPPGGKKYPVFCLSGFFSKSIAQKSRINAGTDFIYEFAHIYSAQKDTIYDASKPLNSVQIGGRLGYELVIGRFSLPFEMGVYLFTKMKYLGRFYHRTGIRYQATPHLFINYTLRSHWATAEHIEIGLGYRF